MVNKILIYLFAVVTIFLVSFIIWNFFLSIYEVKIITDFNESELQVNSKYKIECVGLNSFGWEISFRDLSCKFSVEKGSDLVEVPKNDDKNKFSFVPIKKGNIVILVNSKYSLNPSYLKFNISEL